MSYLSFSILSCNLLLPKGTSLFLSWASFHTQKIAKVDPFPKRLCREVIEVNQPAQIHLLARSVSGSQIHLPMSLYKLCALHIFMSVLSCHPKTSELLDTSMPSTSISGASPGVVVGAKMKLFPFFAAHCVLNTMKLNSSEVTRLSRQGSARKN